MADEQVTLSLEASRLTDKTQEKCEWYFIEVCNKNIYKRMNDNVHEIRKSMVKK